MWVSYKAPQHESTSVSKSKSKVQVHPFRPVSENIFIELMTLDHKLKACREGSK